MKNLLLTVVLACMTCNGQPWEDCITVSVKSMPRAGSVEVVATNGCAVKLLLARISLKYFDRNGFRIGSDSDAGAITIPSFAVAEKIKQTIALPKYAVRAEVRDVLAIK